jgi:hypothetical protein
VLYAIAALIVAFWLVGVVIHIISGFFHLILVAAVAVLLYHFFIGSRSRSG